MLTLCPYMTTPLAALSNTSDEHVIPHALGGSGDFTLRADQDANSRLGASVDSELIHSAIVRLFCVQIGLQTRGKPGRPARATSFKTHGVDVETGRDVDVVFGYGGMQFQYAKPVDVDPASGQIVGIYGMGGQFQQVLAQTRKNMAAKGRDLALGDTHRLDRPRIQGQITADLFPVWRGLIKIAYLATARVLGDDFVASVEGQQYRRAIAAQDRAELAESGLEFQPYADLPFLPEVGSSQHLVACFRSDENVISFVRLFGQPLLSIICVIPAAGVLGPLEGRVIVNDASTRSIVETPFLKAFARRQST